MAPTSRTFVAAWPSPEVAERLDDVCDVDEPGVRPIRPENWHVTLRFCGDVDPDAVIDLVAEASLPIAAVELGPEVVRLDDRQLVIPVSGADDLVRAVDRSIGGLGDRRRRPFFGHLTVARTKGPVDSSLLGAPFQAAFTIDEVAIVVSHLRPTGAVYRIVATVPCEPDPGRLNPRRSRSPHG